MHLSATVPGTGITRGIENIMKWMGRLWRGEIYLSRAFWVFAVLVPLILAIVFKIISVAVMIFMLFFVFSGQALPKDC